MPRKNRAQPHVRYQPNSAHAPEKTRYASKAAAERAIREIRKYHLDAKLTVYQSPVDGGWYLTSTRSTEDR